MKIDQSQHFEVVRAKRLLRGWCLRAERSEKRLKSTHRPSYDDQQRQKDIGYLLLVIENLEKGYYIKRK